MRIIDRYVIREVIPPFLIALLVFTFVLIIPFIIDVAEQMIAKNVPPGMILRLMATLLPSTMALTVPMALLIGLLVGLGRLSADREVVVMLACGISPYRLLQPVLVLAVVCWGVTSWLMLKGMPDGNQRYRELTKADAPNILLAGAWNGLGDLALEQGVAKRDPDGLRLALLSYLRGVVQYVPAQGEPTDELERALAGAARSSKAIGELESNPERKQAFLDRSRQHRAQLEAQFPGSRFIPQ